MCKPPPRFLPLPPLFSATSVPVTLPNAHLTTPRQETTASLRPRATPFPHLLPCPGEGSLQKGHGWCQLGGQFGSSPGQRQHLPLAGSALQHVQNLAQRPSVPPASRGRPPLPPQSTCSASKATRGKLEDETVRGRRDLRPRNCLARFALCKGGEYPRERSAHAFPCSWKLVTVCIGRVGFVGGFFGLFFLSFFFGLFFLIGKTHSQLGQGRVSCGWQINFSLMHFAAL